MGVGGTAPGRGGNKRARALSHALFFFSNTCLYAPVEVQKWYEG